MQALCNFPFDFFLYLLYINNRTVISEFREVSKRTSVCLLHRALAATRGERTGQDKSLFEPQGLGSAILGKYYVKSCIEMGRQCCKRLQQREKHSGLCSVATVFLLPIADCLFCFLLSNSPFSLVFNKIPICFWQIICANNFRLGISLRPCVSDGLLLC